MAVVFERSLNADCRLAIWHITETLDDLAEVLDFIPEHESRLSNFKFDKRKLEWICSRALIKHLIPEIEHISVIYDIFGKPHLLDMDYHISISHTGNYVAVIADRENPVAIDLETIQDRILTIAKRFINEGEMEAINKNHTIDQMHILWSAKEVIYKLYSIGELSFHNEIFINPFRMEEKGELTGFILKDNFTQCYSLNYQKMDNLVLVYGRDLPFEGEWS